jgi:hypothetical protein
MNDASNSLRRGLAITAAPVALLLLLGVGLRYLPGQNDDRSGGGSGQSDPRGGGPPRRFPPPPPMKPVDPATQRALEKVAGGQVEALSRSDFSAALSFSAEDYRRTSSPDSFRSMILGGYRPLTQARRKTFRSALGNGIMVLLPLTVTDPAGLKSEFQYVLTKGPTGWRIVGCSPMGPPPQFAPSTAATVPTLTD